MKNSFLLTFTAIIFSVIPVNAQEDNTWTLEECLNYAWERIYR
jgi:hypothetical protein